MIDPDPTQGEIGRHWQAGANTMTETGLWFKAALDVVERRGTSQSLSRTARLFALLGMAIADGFATAGRESSRPFPGGLATPFAKRTSTATRTPIWISTGLLGTSRSAARLEYPSGTSTLAGAASTVLAGFYCTDRVQFRFTGEGAGAVTRTYRSFSQAADEAGVSRIYLGLHFRFSKDDGLDVRPEDGPRDCHDATAPRGGLRRDLLRLSAVVKVFQISLLRLAGRRSPVQDMILVDGPRVGLFSVPAAVM